MKSRTGEIKLQGRLTIVPCTQRKACEFIAQYHRHHRPPRGSVINMAVVDEGCRVRGVATAGRPVARVLDDGQTLEVNRVATDGCPNACSALYGALARAARSLGYRSIITYTLPSEGGSSLKGAGWIVDCGTRGGEWVHAGRERANDWPTTVKWRWSKALAESAPKPIWPEAGVDSRQLELIG